MSRSQSSHLDKKSLLTFVRRLFLLWQDRSLISSLSIARILIKELSRQLVIFHSRLRSRWERIV